MDPIDFLYLLKDTLCDIVDDAAKGVEACTNHQDRLVVLLHHSILLNGAYRLMLPVAVRLDVVNQAKSVYENYVDLLKTTTSTSL